MFIIIQNGYYNISNINSIPYNQVLREIEYLLLWAITLNKSKPKLRLKFNNKWLILEISILSMIDSLQKFFSDGLGCPNVVGNTLSDCVWLMKGPWKYTSFYLRVCDKTNKKVGGL